MSHIKKITHYKMPFVPVGCEIDWSNRSWLWEKIESSPIIKLPPKGWEERANKIIKTMGYARK